MSGHSRGRSKGSSGYKIYEESHCSRASRYPGKHLQYNVCCHCFRLRHVRQTSALLSVAAWSFAACGVFLLSAGERQTCDLEPWRGSEGLSEACPCRGGLSASVKAAFSGEVFCLLGGVWSLGAGGSLSFGFSVGPGGTASELLKSL